MLNPIEKALSLVIAPQISPYRGPLYFARLQEPTPGATIANQGGFGLVDTGKKKLLVTCNHVWEGFLEEQRKDPDLKLHLCLDLERKHPLVFDVRNNPPLDRDATLDIAVFDMGPVLALCSGLKFYPLNQNPPPRLKKGDNIFVLGNQATNRQESLKFGLTIFALEVSDVGQQGSRFVVELSKLQTRNLYEPARQPQNSPFGGISGSPCFSVTSDRLCKLVGFVGADTCISQTTDLRAEPGLAPSSLWFTHASCLNPNGTIKKL
jgi:hypothetical protein